MINEIKTTSLREKMRPMTPEQIEKMNEGAQNYAGRNNDRDRLINALIPEDFGAVADEPKPLPWWQNYRLLRALFPPKIEPGDVMVFDDADFYYEVVVEKTMLGLVYYKREKFRTEFGAIYDCDYKTCRAFAFCYKKKSG